MSKQKLLLTPYYLFLHRVLFLAERVYTEEKKTMRQGKQWSRARILKQSLGARK